MYHNTIQYQCKYYSGDLTEHKFKVKIRIAVEWFTIVDKKVTGIREV